MFAQYSPLFTSGLLSDPSPSRAPSASIKRRKRTHDSFPLTVNTASVSFSGVLHTSHDLAEDSALILTLMPRRHVDAGRSFLSLDLAESQSMRSMSLRRKDTVTTRATTSFGRSEPNSPSAFSPLSQRIPLSFSQFAPQPLQSPTPTIRRSSREALQLPSPKPAPSSSLPQPPVASHRPNLSLSTVPSSPSSSASPISSFPSPSMHRPSQSAPSLLPPPMLTSPLVSPELSYFMVPLSQPSSPASPPPSAYSIATVATAPAALSSPPVERKRTPTIRSVASQPAPPYPVRSPEPSYLFFSPTSSLSSSSSSAFVAILEPEPAPIPAAPALKPSLSVRSTTTRQLNRSAALAALEGRSRSSSPRTASRRVSTFMSMSDDEDDEDERLKEVLHEEEDVVVPTRASARRVSDGSGARKSCKSTIESFLSPLTNFMDLRDDDISSRSWRSFVEISS